MKEILKYVGYYLRRVYRLSLSHKCYEDMLWADLKKFHAEAAFNSGVFEKEKSIETHFEIAENKLEKFYYQVFDGCYHCRVKILHEFPTEYAIEVFVLASHFNNILSYGNVVINVKSNYVEYHYKRELLLPLLYNAELYNQLVMHFNTAKDVYWAFNRLIEEQEAPAIIMADLLRNKENKDKEAAE